MRDVANMFDQVAVGPMHTPALYSCFLRALISARVDANQDGQQQLQAQLQQHQQHQHQQQQHQQMGGDGELGLQQDGGVGSSSSSSGSGNGNGVHAHLNGHASASALDSFAYTGEMGPVADISTFPPTMAPNSVDHMNVLSMDSILSSEFWDSVLVPGAPPFPFPIPRLRPRPRTRYVWHDQLQCSIH